ncbi:MAG: molecular chaperone DnaK, partial [Gammaproteobacteria bacterium]
EKKEIEDAIADLEESLKGTDKADIEEKTRKLTELSGKLAERAYQANAGEQAEAGTGEPDKAGNGAGGDDNVVDAEFEEVDDDNKK